MRQLGVVQFFSWFGLFSMWVFMRIGTFCPYAPTAPDSDTSSHMYSVAGDHVGKMFGVYNVAVFGHLRVIAAVDSKKDKPETHACVFTNHGWHWV